MRLLILGSVLAATLMSTVGPSRAEVVYPWCLNYDRTTRNCGFTSFQQCLASAQGTGASCERNGRYDAPLAPGDRKVRQTD